MKKKIDQEEPELEEKLKEELEESQNQLDLMKEMTNLRDEGYFRLQQLQIGNQIILQLKKLNQNLEDFLEGEEQEEQEDNGK